MEESNLVLYLISFSNVILSLPFTFFGLSKYQPNEIKADWQPPGYVFGIVWPILYLLFGIINLNIINNKNMNHVIKELNEYNDKVYEYEWVQGYDYEPNTNIKKSWQMKSPYLLKSILPIKL